MKKEYVIPNILLCCNNENIALEDVRIDGNFKGVSSIKETGEDEW